VARDENDGRRATVCATVVDVTEHTYKDRETGSRKRFAKLTLSQNNRLAECVCWNDYYMEHHTVIQSLKDRVVILTAVIRYSDYNGCNTLQTYRNSLLFIQS
jgi:DNA polymerase-3 subunit alpha